VAVITVDPYGLDSELWLKAVVGRVLLQILHELIACHPATELARNPVAGKVRQPADGVQVQTVVAAAPLLSDVLTPLQDDGVCAAPPQCRRGRQSCRTSADDDDILHQQRLPPISASLPIKAAFGLCDSATSCGQVGVVLRHGGRTRPHRSRRYTHLDPTTAGIPDALVEGLSIHRALDNEPHDQAIVSAAVQRITAKSDIRRA
jgi:hypothetical protein